jgi:phosphoribosylanthranilate isomerase
MTWVKVCGLTRREDVDAAVAAGADAVGFVVAPESPRAVSVDAVAKLASGIAIRRVVVTVGLEPAALIAAARHAGVDAVQPHGAHSAAAALAAIDEGLFVLQPIPVGEAVTQAATVSGALPLYDTADAARHGGTGRSFDWELVARLPGAFVIAGGLGPDNVADAVRAVRPFGVDASSRLEAAVGVKDHGKVAAFIREAKEA